jgi:hypothetical protein
VGIATGYGVDDLGVEIRVPVGSRIFFKSSRPFLWPAQPPIQCVPGALSPGVKRPGREADIHLQLVSRSTKGGSIHPLLHAPTWCCV